MTAAGVPAGRSNRRAFVVLVLFALACAGAALALGQSSSWDLRNYHLYAPWAWAHGRMGRDLAPAQVQGFYNPVFHFVTWWGASTLPPRVFAALLGFAQGLNAVPIWMLARRALPDALGARRESWALAVALIGATGATQLGELGATQADNLVSLPFLFGLVLLARAPEGGVARRAVSCGALLVGLAAGTKLTLAPFALGAALAATLMASGARARVHLLLSIGLASGLGFLVAAAPWMVELWARFGSPTFPFSNPGWPGVPTPPAELRDYRFVPHGALPLLYHPLTIVMHPRNVSEEWFRDLRIPLLFLSLPLLLLRPATGADAVRRFLWTMVALGYPFWLLFSGYYRYLLPLEMLAPLLLTATIAARWPDRRWAAVMLAFLAVLVAATTRPPPWGRVPFGERFLSVEAAPIEPGAVVALGGDRPLAFLALELGSEHDYVRVAGNLLGEPKAPWWLDRKVAEALDRGARPVYALFQGAPDAVAAGYARFGLALEAERCTFVRSNLITAGEAPIRLCPATRVQRARDALAQARAPWIRRCDALAPAERSRLPACRAVEESL